jgi:hypothetical protein
MLIMTGVPVGINLRLNIICVLEEQLAGYAINREFAIAKDYLPNRSRADLIVRNGVM